MHVEEGQYVVVYSEGGAETVFATAYGEEDIKRQLVLCRRVHPDVSPGQIRWGKGIRVAHTRREPWTQVEGEEA